MLSRQEEEQERRATLENDRLVREAEQQRILREGTTLHQFAQEETLPRGRYDAPVPAPHIVGSTAIPKYPQASAPFQIDPVGDKPPLPVHDDESSAGFHLHAEEGAPVSAAPPSGVQAPPPAGDVETGTGAPPSREQTK